MAAIALIGTAPHVIAAPGDADPPSGSLAQPLDESFYLPPDPLPPVAPGTVLRAQKFPLALSLPAGDAPIPAEATRLMYMSADTHGRPAAVTGTYLSSSQEWRGPGRRPLVAVAVGTQGQGDQCASSKTLGEAVHYSFPLDLWANYEVITAYSLLARGMDVVMTDYHGLGTPAVHDYLNRAAEAHAVLDSIRAAEAFRGTRVPTLIFGYSQGGGAAAAAAELQSTYAPDLDVLGTYAGAPPADLRALMSGPVINGIVPGVIGGDGTGLIGYVLNGFRADYPQAGPAIDEAVNPAGRAMLDEVAGTCLAESAIRTVFRPITHYTEGGKSMEEVLEDQPVLGELMDKQRIGTMKPEAPVLIAAGTNDDVILYGQARRLARDWCGLGATVQLDTTDWIPPVLPGLAVGHVLELFPALNSAHHWITDRLAGVPVQSSCGSLEAER